MLLGRRARQHPRPRARRRGDRLHQAAARLAAVQPRRRLDHARHPDPVRARSRRSRRADQLTRQRAPFTIAYQDEHLLVVDKGPGVVVHPARGHREDTLAQLLAPLLAGGEGGGTLIERGSSTAWTATPRACSSSRAPRRLTGVCRRRSPSGGSSASTSRWSRAARRRARARSRPRSGAIRACARAWRSAAPTRARRAPTSRSSARSRAPRCCACGWRPGAPTRSAFTCRRSAIRCAATPSTGPPGLLGLERQFLHATRLAFDHPLTGERVEVVSPLPRGPARAHWSGPKGYPEQAQPRSLDPCGRSGSRPCPEERRSVAASGSAPSARKLNAYIREQPVADVGIAELLEAGVHFGHQTRRWNPKMRRFIYGERGGIYIIDLLKTAAAAGAGAGVRRASSPTAAARSCSWAPRSRRATPSATSPRRPTCRTSTTAGSAGC